MLGKTRKRVGKKMNRPHNKITMIHITIKTTKMWAFYKAPLRIITKSSTIIIILMKINKFIIKVEAAMLKNKGRKDMSNNRILPYIRKRKF